MESALKQMQPVLAFAAANLDANLSLAALAAQAGLSEFHLHRVFSAVIGETPKRLTLRLRLGRAAVLLLIRHDSVLDIALDCGFQSHEVFCRVFRRRFGITPSAYRKRGFAGSIDRENALDHAAVISQVGPCVGLFHAGEGPAINQGEDMTYAIEKKELQPQPVLLVRRRIEPSEIASTLADVLQQVFLYAQKSGVPLAGQPFTRYVEWGPGLITIEAGIPIAVSGIKSSEPGIVADTLPGGSAAATVHNGPYEKLREAHAAVQVWIEANGLAAAGPPWECYVTDPADYPNPQDWKTDVFWPLAP